MDRHWILGADGRFYNYDYLIEGSRPRGRRRSSGTARSRPAGLRRRGGGWELRDHLRAARAVWTGVAYELEQGWRRSRQPDGRYSTFSRGRTREMEPPSYFRKEEPQSDTLDFAALHAHIGVAGGAGPRRGEAARAAPPQAVVPPGERGDDADRHPVRVRGGPPRRALRHRPQHRDRHRVLDVLSVFEALGNNALLPPMLAAWAPNLLFGAAGLYLMLTLET